ncbi:hypothetical protein WH95_06225 [Kiloniella litopenaei]|uniref:AAA+ ATPase domain-containing protein n=1 Tax=Kiloniella litopenaei TaxID=1549748 RepID=A0A0M2R7U9_9PROT|nr:ATP-binding protein [Kiloniella litopenaei]KKJ77997.1 hypothetical protein WH95_06225 [Kiloniella litopenaei]
MEYEFNQIAEIRNVFVENQGTHFAHQRLLNYVMSEKQSRQGSCMCLIGDSGAGKTTFIQNFISRNPELKILRVDVPPSCSIKAFTQEILKCLGDIGWANTRSTGVQLSMKIKYVLEKKGIDLIVFDEAQHFVETKKKSVIYDVADWLKNGLNEWKVPILLTGLDRLNSVFAENEQLERRLKGRLEFNQNQSGDEQARKDWLHFLHVISNALPFHGDSNLEEPKMAQALWIGSSRLRGRAIRLIERAAEISFWNEESRLSPSSLSEAFIELANREEKSNGNPFLGMVQ